MAEASAAAHEQGCSLELEYFTDPLCCWSWAMEPQLRRFREALGPELRFRPRMGGMIASWDRYYDPLQVVREPVHMAPIWFQARHTLHVDIDDQIWYDDPPASSHPACVAVKAAEMQSDAARDLYLFSVRRAVMSERRNIAKREVLVDVGKQLAAEHLDEFDLDRFHADLDNPAAQVAFQDDVERCRALRLGRFPSLILRRPGQARGILLVGYKPFETLIAAAAQLRRDAATQPECCGAGA